MVLDVLVGHVTVITQQQFQQFVEFLVPSVQFLDRVADFPVACRSWYAQCTLYSRPWRSDSYSSWDGCRRACCCAATGTLVGSCSKLWSFRSCSFGCRPVSGQACCARRCNDCGSRNACFDIGYMLFSSEVFGRIFIVFLREGIDSAPELDSRPGRHIVDNGSGMYHTGFAVLTHLALCSHDCRQFADRCFSCSRVALGNLYIMFYEPPVFSAFSRVPHFARVDFLEPSSTHRCECSRAGSWR